jgi:hypothetical protein
MLKQKATGKSATMAPTELSQTWPVKGEPFSFGIRDLAESMIWSSSWPPLA